MKRLQRIISWMVAVILLFSVSGTLAETDTSTETTSPGYPAYHSDFTASVHLYADGFPDDGKAHYTDWEKLFSRLCLKGTVDTQLMLDPYSRVYMNASILLDDTVLYPFEYDGYYSFRYLRSPAVGNTSLHFQMGNFIEFMLKAYYYLDWPTPWLALALYPEESVYWAQTYSDLVSNTIDNNAKTVSYDDLYELCLTLDDLIAGETEYRSYYYVTAALVDLGENDRLLAQLGSLESVLEMLDPDCNGLTIQCDGNQTTYTLGTNDLLIIEENSEGIRWNFEISDTDEYHYSVRFQKESGEIHLFGEMSCDGDVILSAALDLDGIGAFGDLGGRGSCVLTFNGSGLREPMDPIRVDWVLTRNTSEYPQEVELNLDWIHPETEKKALGVSWKAVMTEEDRSILKERSYDNQDDLLHMNEGILEELMVTALPAFLKYSLPLIPALPSGVISDVMAFLRSSGLLAE